MPIEKLCPACGSRLPADERSHSCPVGILRLALADTGDEPDAPDLAEGKIVGDCEILGQIGRGGMGVVYRARQRSLDRVVALKMIRSGEFASEQERQRFRTEAKAAGSLDHPNIVPIFDVGEHDGQPFFTMPLIAGGALSGQSRALGRAATGAGAENRWHAAARLIARAARAVHHAHQRGVVHRDLKPSNILIDAQGEPHLTDFGLAKLLEGGDGLSHSAAVLGTPGYMSPEQAAGRNRELTTAVDIYGLGAILYELLTGRPPFTGDSTLELLRKIVEEAPARPSQLARRLAAESGRPMPGIDADLETICLKCLEKEPQRRYGSAEAVAEDLERWLRHEPILARPVGIGERAWKWVRRHPARAAAIGVSVGAVLLTVALTWNHQTQLHRRDQFASRQREESLKALAELGFVGTDASFNSGEAPKAVAFLARSLRENPSNQWAAERLMSALTYRSFALPALEPLRHARAVNSAPFSPDGARILTASDDGTARLWDARTGQPLTVPLSHPTEVLSARFSPDGRLVVTGGADGFARLWDAHTGRPVGQPMAHSNEVRRVEFSARNDQVLTVSGQLVRVWDAQSGLPLSDWMPHRTGDPNVRSAQFRPGGREVLTADGDAVRRWSFSADGSLKREKFETRIAQCARFNPDGRRIVIGSGTDTAQVWRLGETNASLTLRAHGGDVDWAEFSPDGGRVVTVSKDRTARVWDAYTGDLLFGPLLHEGRVTFAQWSASGVRLLTLAEDRAVRVWDGETGEALCEPLRHEAPVTSADFSPDGQFIVTASADGAARVWDARAGGALGASSSRYSGDLDLYRKSTLAGRNHHVVQLTNLQPRDASEPVLPHTVQPFLAHLSPQGRWFVTREADGSLRLWDEQTGAPAPRAFRHDGPIRNLSVSPDRRHFAVVGADHVVHLWSTNESQPPRVLPEHIGLAFDPLFSPDSKRLLLVANGGVTLQLWDTSTGEPASAPFAPHKGGTLCARFSPDGQWLATGSYDMTAAISDARTGEKKTPALPHDGYVRCVEFSPDGRWLVTGSDAMSAQVWDVQTGRRVSDLMQHPAGVSWAAFSPDAKRVVTFAGDRAARIWDAYTGQRVSEPLRHLSRRDDLPAWQGRFNADGTQILTWPRPTVQRTWDMGAVSVPVPSWLPDLAEAVGGLRLREGTASEAVSWEEFFKSRRALGSSLSSDYYGRWAAWFFADRSVRPTSPFSSTTVPEYVRQQAEEEDWHLMIESVREALRLAPTNGVALLRLARAKVKQAFDRPKTNATTTAARPSGPAQPAPDSRELQRRRLLDEADFHSRRALELVPAEREAWLARIEVLLNTQRKEEALALADKAVARFPGDSVVEDVRAKVFRILEQSR